MGSASDFGVMEKAARLLGSFEVPYEVHILSAHRTPLEAAELAQNAAGRGVEVIIAAAGMAAHLAGAVAAHTTLPVIGVPVAASLGGIDALLSTVQMPPDVPVASVGINAAANAALLAVQILAIHTPSLRQKLADHKAAQRRKVLASSSQINREGLPFCRG